MVDAAIAISFLTAHMYTYRSTSSFIHALLSTNRKGVGRLLDLASVTYEISGSLYLEMETVWSWNK
jgi:hypothetical protein